MLKYNTNLLTIKIKKKITKIKIKLNEINLTIL